MKQHLIVLDLDGTLLNDEQKISAQTKNILLKAQDEGHIVMIATGRPFRASSVYYNELKLSTPIVNFNGAYIHHPKNKSWEAIHSPIQKSVVDDVVDSVGTFQFENLIAEVKDDVYIHVADEAMANWFNMGNPRVTMGNLKFNLTENPTSLLIHTDEYNMPIIRNHLQTVHAQLIEHRRWGAPFNVIEIVRKGLNKAVGVAAISKYLNIPRERIIAFGDEDNDLEMIEYAGIGVAMSNGIQSLKQISNEITLSNNEDGIAIFLKERLKL